MALEAKPLPLSLSIPTSVQMATEATVGGNKMCSYSTQQAYRFPVSPLKHSVRVSLDSPAAQVDPATSLKVKDIAAADVMAIAKLLESMKGTLDQATKAFDVLAGDVKPADDTRNARAELEDRTTRQETGVQEPLEKLKSEVRNVPGINLRDELAVIIQEFVENEMEDQVNHEHTGQTYQSLYDKIDLELEGNDERDIALESDSQSDPDTPVISPQENISIRPNIPILLYQDASDDEADCYETYQQNSCPMLDTTALFPPTEHTHFSTRMRTTLFDEPSEHEPPPPSPAPVVGPFRFLLRPLPTPEQSPAYVIHDSLPSTASSCCATPVTAYPRVPAPTPTTNEPTFMLLPINSAPVSALTPDSASSPLAPRDANLLFALSSEQNKELLRHHDLDGFVLPTPMAAWPKRRTIVKTPMSLRASPLMIPPPLEVDVRCCNRNPMSVPESPAESPVLFVPPPRPGPRAGSSFADNLKLLPPLVIT